MKYVLVLLMSSLLVGCDEQEIANTLEVKTHSHQFWKIKKEVTGIDDQTPFLHDWGYGETNQLAELVKETHTIKIHKKNFETLTSPQKKALIFEAMACLWENHCPKLTINLGEEQAIPTPDALREFFRTNYPAPVTEETAVEEESPETN